jgi:hypothetical protein
LTSFCFNRGANHSGAQRFDLESGELPTLSHQMKVCEFLFIIFSLASCAKAYE